ncbi:alpha/beta hydrolase family esterase [Capillimicrobium parvum]|nr:hypothetical protein [Capillimicrobium parvum]
MSRLPRPLLVTILAAGVVLAVLPARHPPATALQPAGHAPATALQPARHALATAFQPAGPRAPAAAWPGRHGCGGGADLTVEVRSGGRRRVALVHVPRGVRRGAPLMMALHGAHADGPFMARYSGLSRVADRAGFVVAYPSSLGRPAFWDLTGPGDVAFGRRLVDRLWRTGCVDTRRTYAVGVSNGGGMTARLGCELSSRLAGIVVVAGGFRSLPACAPDRPVSVLEIHGTDDQVVPYAGRADDGFAGDVRAWVDGWVRRDGCLPQPRERLLAPRAEQLAWGPCAQGSAVEHIVLQGGQHAWPGATPPDPGPRASISAAAQAWRFLRSRRLAHAPAG